MMRILMFNYEYPPLGGGAANACYYKIQEFKQMPGIEIDLITSSTSGFRIDTAGSVRIHYLDIGKNEELLHQGISDLLRYSWKSYRYAKKLHKAQAYDAVHAFFGIPSGYYARFFGVPYIVSLMGSDVPFHTQKYYWLDKLLFFRLNRKQIWPKSFALVANSEGLKDEVLALVPQQFVHIIENGVDTDFFCPTTQNNDLLELVSVSRITQHKGYQFLFAALSKLEGYHLTLVGDGPDVAYFRQLAQQLNVNVSFTGRLEKEAVRNQLQQADLFLLPSLNEGMSNAAMEAMACGLPLVMTDVGGAQELIQGNGFILPKTNAQTIEHGLKKAIQTYLETPRLLEQHSKRSREIALSKSWKAAAQAYYNLYLQATTSQ